MANAPTAGLRIDEAFRNQLFPLSAVEFAHLEQSLLAEGCRESLIAWNGTLVDGHNRYDICTRHDIPFGIEDRQFASRADVEDWIDCNQAGRRNLSPADFAIVSGRIYNRRKKANGERGPQKLPQFDGALST